MHSTDPYMPVDVDQEEESKSFSELVSYWKHVSEKKKPIEGEEVPVRNGFTKEESEDDYGMIHPTPIRISPANTLAISIDPHRTLDRTRDLKKQVLQNEHMKKVRQLPLPTPVPPPRPQQKYSQITANDVEEIFGFEEPAKVENKTFKRLLLKLFR
ncbi:unnamed protein product [Rhizopus stolonifer]